MQRDALGLRQQAGAGCIQPWLDVYTVGVMSIAASPAVPADSADAPQTVKAQLLLRELIVGGELAPGERVPELALVERLGVSRAPVRTALTRLLEEGLLVALPGGGYVV